MTFAGDLRPRFARVEHLWGTAITLKTADAVDPTVLDEVFAWFHRVDDLFSTWREDTEISRLGRNELTLRAASPEVRTVLALCDRVTEDSRGAFDMRVGADPRVTPRAGLGPIDPSGLVKGWALERAAELLRSRSVRSFTINAGGDVITTGNPAPGEQWRTGIQHPWITDRLAAVVETTDAGIATSGRYERGDHIIDPHTGAPATALQSVTVIADDLALADAYATAALVLGHEGLTWLTDDIGVAAMTIDNESRVTVNDAFQQARISIDPAVSER